ncbi:hypothetical protein [Chitinophaga sp. MD30]|uniref:hypothetical protein n=1 Tax=Chitinophaga sp. MD30 TaxID=2033437 RepID=UPI0012FD1543|nr:hypothetical protein [Chitinophaga sp. MD30]
MKNLTSFGNQLNRAEMKKVNGGGAGKTMAACPSRCLPLTPWPCGFTCRCLGLTCSLLTS